MAGRNPRTSGKHEEKRNSAMSNARELAKRGIRQIKNLQRLNTVLATVILPACFAVVLTFSEEILTINDTLFYGAVAIIIVIQMPLSFLLMADIQLAQQVQIETSEIFEENTMLIEENSYLEYELKYFSSLQEASYQWMNMQRNYIDAGFQDLSELKEAIDEILNVIVVGREQLFDMKSDELWNFAVYLYSTNDKKLKPAWRVHHHKLDASGDGRIWAPGEGHVGQAYQGGNALITNDATDKELVEVFKPKKGNERKEVDTTVYISFASIPIGPFDEKDDPFGVLVATSDTARRFDDNNSLILRHASVILANIIAATDANALIDCARR